MMPRWICCWAKEMGSSQLFSNIYLLKVQYRLIANFLGRNTGDAETGTGSVSSPHEMADWLMDCVTLDHSRENCGYNSSRIDTHVTSHRSSFSSSVQI